MLYNTNTNTNAIMTNKNKNKNKNKNDNNSHAKFLNKNVEKMSRNVLITTLKKTVDELSSLQLKSQVQSQSYRKEIAKQLASSKKKNYEIQALTEEVQDLRKRCLFLQKECKNHIMIERSLSIIIFTFTLVALIYFWN